MTLFKSFLEVGNLYLKHINRQRFIPIIQKFNNGYCSNIFSESPTKVQHARMLKLIRESDNPREAAAMNSAGLTEAAVEFVKMQSSFVHKVKHQGVKAHFDCSLVSISPHVVIISLCLR